ncbi:MAG: M1 family metallopeptidase [Bacteroidia bacterium]
MRKEWACSLLSLGVWGWAQRPYFQQRVEYQIKVQLDAQQHLLRGHIRFVYRNNSPDTLPGLYIHLWPNAYSRRGTALDKQQRARGESRFFFARKNERGYIDSLDFRVDGVPVRPLPAWRGPKPAEGHPRRLLKSAPDVVWLPFPTPLPPAGHLTVETPFRVKLPPIFSRLGHDGSQYAITQWYPKPAVYDARGWHPLPYLDQGEFYSEWGRYEVEITVPQNFVVAASGVLQTPEEWRWLRQRELETRQWIAQQPDTPTAEEKVRRFLIVSFRLSGGKATLPLNAPSWARDDTPAPAYKTLRFTQDSIHDFAWFADPRYALLSDSTAIAPGKWVRCVAVFRLEDYRSWQYVPSYIAEALQSLSAWVGPYPYAHATAVEGPLAAGGGMEYPMITIISPIRDTSQLRRVVVHEVGHNWFQGLLGSNERLHPWQDEGINSYYERRIIEADPIFSGGGEVIRPIGPGRYTSIPAEMLFYHHLNADVAPGASSYHFGSISYGLGAYNKTAYLLRSLVLSVGSERWDAAMQTYFQRWAFRHPYPEDWAESLESQGVPGQAMLRLLRTDREPDLRLRFRRLSDSLYQVRVEEPTRLLPRPFRVEALAIERPGWIAERYTLPLDSTLDLSLPPSAHLFVVNPQLLIYERRVGNNFFYRRRFLPGWRRLKWGVVAPLTRFYLYQYPLGLLPALGYNYRDGLMAGALLYGGLFPKRTLEFHLLPLYSFLRQELRGSAGLTLRAFPADGRLHLIEMRLRTSNFAGLWRVKAAVEGFLRRSPEALIGWRQVVRLRSYHLAFQSPEKLSYNWENGGRPAYVALDWEGRREEAITTLFVMGSVGHDLRGGFRTEGELRAFHRFRHWHIWARLYGGWVSADRADYLLFRPAGYDPFGEYVLLDRFREGKGVVRRQFPENQGGWRTPADTLRTSALLAVNLELPLPYWHSIVLRTDAGYLPQMRRTYWGISLGLPVYRFRDRLLVGGYFPLLGTTFEGERPKTLRAVVERFVWQIEVPLDLRWAIPW